MSAVERTVVWAADRPVPIGVVESPAEEWRPIPSAPGYQASSEGRIRSHRRYPNGKLISQHIHSTTGYPAVGIYIANKQKTKLVHWLVAEAFYGPRPYGYQVRHLDGSRTNNAAKNLRFGTQSENEMDKVAHGRHPNKSKTHCPHGHEYSAENTYVKGGTNGWRRCRTCEIDRQRVLRETAKGAAA